ncbi:Outer membrane protein (porin) [Collimonas sp. OK607]|uniref:porin n=1 Tax=Collimonas sp. OK607 TaxID=1798194 RepID=UPI0008E8B6A0|nr:porin [Collimonas sp. OK607]SFA75298.1 Outer membrane protein (porin) [Collimonas sp. OK607]
MKALHATKATILLGSVMASTALHAQTNVQIYGIVDVGVEYVNKARVSTAGTATGSLAKVDSGNAAASRIGFRGREDLGDGLAAVFGLENGFSADTGALANGGRLFGRQAYVGLAGKFGEVQLGRETTPIFDFGAIYDPMIPARYSALALDAAFASRADNAIRYGGKFGGLTLSTQYSFGFDSTIVNGGEVPGAFQVGKEASTNINYQFGNVLAGVLYDRQNGTSVATQKNSVERMAVGITADFKPVKLYAAFQRRNMHTAPTSTRTNLYWVAMSYNPTAAVTLLAAAYSYDPAGASNRTGMYTLLGSYALSKRTDIYSELGIMRNQAKAAMALDGTVNPGDSQAGLTLGIRHRF